MKRIVFYITSATILTAFDSCKKPLDIKTTDSNANVLVVEGLINIGADSTKIKLSRTVIIGNKTTINPENKAIVTIENAQVTVATLPEIAKGTYAVPGLNLDKTKQYRVRVKTSNGKVYLSELVDAKVTPPIDSVGYKINADGIQVYANTHDDTNNSRYYLYNYDEAWKFNTKYVSGYISNGSSIVPRSIAQSVGTCYTGGSSNIILVTSTAALSQDVSHQFILSTIQASSERISIKYSIQVTQTVLTKQAYTFWENLRKNTEQLGSIFDAQPSLLTGNVYNIADANEPVIGYISAGTTQKKRIFIDRKELPANWVTEYPFACPADTARGGDIASLLIPLTSGRIVLSPVEPPNAPGWIYSTPACADCTIRGHVQAPSFWK
jgi:hypothetical protein